MKELARVFGKLLQVLGVILGIFGFLAGAGIGTNRPSISIEARLLALASLLFSAGWLLDRYLGKKSETTGTTRREAKD